MTYDEAVEAAKRGEVVTRPNFTEEYLCFDHVKGRMYTVDRHGHKAAFWPVSADRESTEWFVIPH